jgi:hypothetical protein
VLEKGKKKKKDQNRPISNNESRRSSTTNAWFELYFTPPPHNINESQRNTSIGHTHTTHQPTTNTLSHSLTHSLLTKKNPFLHIAGVILLKEGTDTSQGLAMIVSNINACQAIVDIIRPTLGPKGLDLLVHDGANRAKEEKLAFFFFASKENNLFFCSCAFLPQVARRRFPTTALPS